MLSAPVETGPGAGGGSCCGGRGAAGHGMDASCFWYDAPHGTAHVERIRFIMNAGRTTKQGQQVNVGKDHADYQETVSTMSMHPDDMKTVGIVSGSKVRVRSQYGEATFRCVEGKVPPGMIFVPYGPPTCRVMGTYTDGTGMPTSKGWEVDVEPIDA